MSFTTENNQPQVPTGAINGLFKINSNGDQVYFSKGKAKIEFGLCRGKKLYDKRESIAKKDYERETRRDFKNAQNM